MATLGDTSREKLGRDNFLLWKATVLPPIRGAQLDGYLDGTIEAPAKTLDVQKADKSGTETVPNPEYARWIAQDQQVLGSLLTSLSREVLTQVVSMKTSAQVWTALEEMYSSVSRSRVIQLRTLFAGTRKNEMTATAYFTKMRGIADELTAAGKKIEDDDLISQILAGLDAEYNPFVSSIAARTDAYSLSEIYAQFLAFEARLESQNSGSQQYNSSVNLAARGGHGKGNRGGKSSGGGNRGGYGNNNRGGYNNYGNNNNNNNYGNNYNHGNNSYPNNNRGGGRPGPGGGANLPRGERPTCQICGKVGHPAHKCWYRFDPNYVTEERYGGAATTSYGVDSNWYFDTGATDHITGELDKLTTRARYNGPEQVHAANGAGPSNEGNTSARPM